MTLILFFLTFIHTLTYLSENCYTWNLIYDSQIILDDSGCYATVTDKLFVRKIETNNRPYIRVYIESDNFSDEDFKLYGVTANDVPLNPVFRDDDKLLYPQLLRLNKLFIDAEILPTDFSLFAQYFLIEYKNDTVSPEMNGLIFGIYVNEKLECKKYYLSNNDHKKGNLTSYITQEYDNQNLKYNVNSCHKIEIF